MTTDVIIYQGEFDPAHPPEAPVGGGLRFTVCKTPEELRARLGELQRERAYFQVKCRQGRLMVDKDSIVYCRACGHRYTVCLADGRRLESLTTRSSFADSMAELLADRRFFQCSSSAVVNLDYVTGCRDSLIYLKNGETLKFPAKWHIRVNAAGRGPGQEEG